MEWYAQYYGEWSSYYEDYKWQPLNGGHNAIVDCLACLDLIKEMAADEIFDLRELFESVYGDG
jgi:DNA polymerase III subunit epsilon